MFSGEFILQTDCLPAALRTRLFRRVLKGTHPDLLGDSTQLHRDVPSRVSYSDHHHPFVPPLLGRLVVAAVEELSREGVDSWGSKRPNSFLMCTCSGH